MASKGPKSRLDHEPKAKRQKALEPPKEPRRPKTHWDHVLEEMVWLSKDFESERKWKLAQAKKVAIKASKGMVDQATRGERRLKEEELRMRKVALNISKDVKKFWTKIEKLVLYKHQLELDEKKKKALDKQLEFLLGQTERYSTKLAENLVDAPVPPKPIQPSSPHEQLTIQPIDDQDDASKCPEPDFESQSNIMENDEDYVAQSEDEPEDDEHTIEEDEALITEQERQEELEALQNEIDLPLEELLKRYTDTTGSRDSSPERNVDVAEPSKGSRDNSPQIGSGNSPETHIVKHSSPTVVPGHRSVESNGNLSVLENQDHQIVNCEKGFQSLRKKQLQYDFQDENEDGDFILANGEEKDDETTLSEEEELAKEENNEAIDEIALLQNESSIPIEELLARYRKHSGTDKDSEDGSESEYASGSDDFLESPTQRNSEAKLNCVSTNEGDEVPSERHEHTGSFSGKQKEKSDEIIENGENNEDRIADAAAAARSAQPTGNTFLTTKVRTKFPFLLKFSLREYQHIGLDWLVTMYEQRLNGILADEMGLGKTIMTIALLAHLACEKGIWGPHLIVVPTSVMLNWETEFLKWCPAFKILTYFGSAKERKIKRQGWLKPNYFHVCITTYRLVIQDSKIFKRKKWKYLILDEAHLIKNWKSQRWQTLLNFNTKRRILLTGTPLQNDLMELWSLMHFLMPHIFQSHQEFKDWFSNPISGMVEGQEKVNKEVVDRLHNVLRPFILRRLKRDVEKQLPSKHEHVIYCRLSRRQRNLYEDFIASSETQATLANGNFFGMIGVIMQLRKVCNHPDLFEGRPIISSFDMSGIDVQLSSSACSMLMPTPFSVVDLSGLGFIFTHLDFSMTSWESDEVQSIATPSSFIESRADRVNLEDGVIRFRKKSQGFNIFEEIQRALFEERLKEAKERAASIAWWNSLRCKKKPIYSTSLRDLITVNHSVSVKIADIVLSPIERFQKIVNQIESFMFAIPAARAPQPTCWCSKPRTSVFMDETFKERCSVLLSPLLTPIRPAIVRRQVYFPDRRLIQFDCGKLQELAVLLRRLKSEGHRALIFTQMTKMLDVLEAFISLYGYTYMRLDGSTQPEERQTLMQRFNTNPKFFLFILSTRSGGVGINLVGADTVIFYDSDWNPAMDQQAQDRCHRIGQTREVHIYRLISESTIEENILRKAKQKRALDDLVIQSGEYNTEFFKKLDPLELFSGHETVPIKDSQKEKVGSSGVEASVTNADVEAALKHAEDEADYMALKKVEEEEAVENQEFTEEARPEDDELVNDEDMKADESIGHGGLVAASVEENGQIIMHGSEPNEERAITVSGKEDDIDMLDDVKQMAAAAAAAGQTIVSFESQLRPIDRYAVRFLELWDPIIDRAVKDSDIRFEETEWELDHIEKLKDDMEAEIDDDEQPFVYESWDSEFATKVYREQVETLAQQQLMEDRENEAREKELAELADSDSMKNEVVIPPRPKSKKKPKKTKFKSLKKEALASASEAKASNMESPLTPMSLDFEDSYDVDPSSDIVSSRSNMSKKRKGVADGSEVKSAKKSKKLKKTPEIFRDLGSPSKLHDESKDTKACGNGLELVHKPLIRSKMGVKISITPMPVKRVLTIRPEKVKRKVSIWSKDYLANPDPWIPSEDAILSAVVHEYGPHWSLVSDVLYGMTSSGFYRGMFRHPVHCCERFRELIQRYVLSSADNLNNEKSPNACPAKVLLKVTEDHVRMLLDVVSDLPDQEPIIQKHFFAVLSSAWRETNRRDRRRNLSSFQMGRFLPSTVNQTPRVPEWLYSGKKKFTNINMCAQVVAAVLNDAYNVQREERVPTFSQREEVPASTDLLRVTLEIPAVSDDKLIQLPPVVEVSIHGSDAARFVNKGGVEDDHFRSSQYVAETRLRDASRTCEEGNLGWALSAFTAGHINSRTPSRSQALGKHKLPISESVSTPSKSKVRKITMNQGDLSSLPLDPDFQSMVAVTNNDLYQRLDMGSPVQDVGTDVVFGTSSSLDIDNELALGIDSYDTIPHNYSPDFIAGLDECSLLTDFIDIG